MLDLKRISTGIPGLDGILLGGIPEFANILLAGAPGSGKTILTQNILFNINKTTGRNVVYFTTLTEPQIKVIRYQQKFSFFNVDTFMNSVIFQDIGYLIRTKGLREGLAAINEIVMKYNPAVVAIDSFKALAGNLPSPEHFREFLTELSIYLPIWECTVILTGEYMEDELKKQQEAAVVDGIIYLYGMDEHKHQKRYLRIMKMRGTDFFQGEHILKISRAGVNIYPRWKPGLPGETAVIGTGRQKTGTPGLDEILGGRSPCRYNDPHHRFHRYGEKPAGFEMVNGGGQGTGIGNTGDL